MPNVMLTIPNVTQSVQRPVIFDIVQQVKEITKISESTDVYFLNDEGFMKSAGSGIGEGQRDPQFTSKRRVLIEVEQTTNLDNLATSVSNRSEHIPVLEDEKIGFLVRPIYESTDVRINFKYRTVSKQEAKRWKDDIAIRVSAMRDMFVHNIHYHYGLPFQIWNLMGEIHNKREMNKGYGETFAEYIDRLSKGRLTLVGEGTGTSALPVIAEKGGRIIGQFDFDAIPEKADYEEENGTYLISFTYKFTYDCPVGCNAVYPIMVHNQYLRDEYIIDTTTYPRNDRTPKVYRESGYAFAGFESETTMNSVQPFDPYIRIPDIDDYIMPMTHAGTATALLLLMKMENEGVDQTLFNLEDLGDIQIDQDLMTFIREVEWPYMTKIYKSVFNISLLEDRTLCDPERVTVNQRLDVISKKAIDLRKTYRVRISLVVDLSLLDPAALERLAKYPKAFVKFFKAANELLRYSADFQRLGDQKFISNAQINVIKMLMGGVSTAGGWTTGNHNEVVENNWTRETFKGNLFKGVPWSTVQSWIKNAISMKTVQVTGVIAYLKVEK